MSTPIVLSGLAAVQEAKGRHLGHSDWLEITQERVDQFAEATGDHQWIHVDVERSRREGRFGGTIAHGYLTLSLASYFLPQIVRYEGFTMAVNYGVDKVRFPAPVPVGSRIRAGAEITGSHRRRHRGAGEDDHHHRDRGRREAGLCDRIALALVLVNAEESE